MAMRLMELLLTARIDQNSQPVCCSQVCSWVVQVGAFSHMALHTNRPLALPPDSAAARQGCSGARSTYTKMACGKRCRGRLGLGVGVGVGVRLGFGFGFGFGLGLG